MENQQNKEDIPIDFGNTNFLLKHIHSILQFYDDRCSDSKGGGFFQYFKVYRLQYFQLACLNVIC